MSQPSSPPRPVEPAGDTPKQSPAPAPRPGQNAPGQAWKIVALAVALVILAVLLFFLFAGPTEQQSGAPEHEEYSEEEEAEEAQPPATTPPPPSADDPRPSTRSSGRSSEGAPPPEEAALPPLTVLSVGYSYMPALRVVALRIGMALPYFMHEGDSIGDIKIVAIMSDRVQISHKGKKYEITVGSDGQLRVPGQGR